MVQVAPPLAAPPSLLSEPRTIWRSLCSAWLPTEGLALRGGSSRLATLLGVTGALAPVDSGLACVAACSRHLCTGQGAAMLEKWHFRQAATVTALSQKVNVWEQLPCQIR